jgi:hypothetical protein
MMQIKDFETHFPKELDPNRYIEFNFYAPDFTSTVTKQLENVVIDTTNTTISVASGNTTGLWDKVKKVGNDVIGTGDLIIGTLASNIKDRANNNFNTTTKDVDTSKKWIFQINLPIPNNLEESLKHEWNTENGPVASILNAGANSGLQQIVNGIAALTGTRNVTTNPDYVQMYKGSQPRSMTFSWTLIPNSKEEAELMLSIIRRFKSYSSPNPSVSGAFLTAPLFCNVKIKNKNLDDTIHLTNMVIDSVTTNYAGGGFMEMFSDGIPKVIVLTVNMIERKPKMAEDWLNESEKKYYGEKV